MVQETDAPVPIVVRTGIAVAPEYQLLVRARGVALERMAAKVITLESDNLMKVQRQTNQHTER